MEESRNSSFDVFKEIVNRRQHWKWFDPDHEISEDLLREIMCTAQRAPSSFNTQPYKVILVKDAKYKLALADAALADSNKTTVLNADTSAIFLSDIEVRISLHLRCL